MEQFQTSSSTDRPPRKRRAPTAYTTSVNINSLPRRSSNRLKQKQIEQMDYSRLPPKYCGPPAPSMKFCDYVLNQLLSSKYEPINWLIELPTVKKKLNYRQYANAEEFANEIRTLCMNPIDAALTDECLSLLQAFDQLWLYLPCDPEEPSSASFDKPLEMNQDDKMLQKLLLDRRHSRRRNKRWSDRNRSIAWSVADYDGASEKSNTQRLMAEVVVQESSLKNVKKKRMTTKKVGGEVSATQQSVLDSASATLSKCGVIPSSDNDSSEMLVPDENVVEEATSVQESNHLAKPLVSQKSMNTNNRPEIEDDAAFTHEEMVQLAQELQQLSNDERIELVRVVLKYHTVEVPEGDEEVIAIPFDSLTSRTLHEIRENVTTLLSKKQLDEPYDGEPSTSAEQEEPSIAQANVGQKYKKVRQKNAKSRKPVKKRVNVVDVEARKRELVEGIKKLGGTGTTRPMRKQNSYASEDTRLRSSYVVDSSSESSSSSSESWESSGSSDSLSD